MKILRKPSFWLPTIFLSVIYLIISTYLTNYRLVMETVFGPYVLDYKLSVLISLVGGLETALPKLNILVLIVISVLTGANITLLIVNVRERRRLGVHCVATGASIFGSLVSICGVCSLPLLTFFGLGGSFFWLTLGGNVLSSLTIIVLTATFYFSLRSDMLITGGEVKINEK